MKYIKGWVKFLLLTSVFIFFLFFSLKVLAVSEVSSTHTLADILTKDSEQVLDPYLGSKDPVREGMQAAIEGQEDGQKIENLLSQKTTIEDHSSATQKTMKIIKIIINYVLWFASVVALVILLIGGFKILTAAGDEKATGTGMQNIKKVWIALIGIGLSWLFVSLIFWLLNLIVWA